MEVKRISKVWSGAVRSDATPAKEAQGMAGWVVPVGFAGFVVMPTTVPLVA